MGHLLEGSDNTKFTPRGGGAFIGYKAFIREWVSI